VPGPARPDPGPGADPGRLDRIVERLAADGGRHLLTGPADEQELLRIEGALSLRLPPRFRALLGRLGGGILYDRHELFGPRPLQLHDIEFVPSLQAMRARFASSGPELLPFHREGGLVHAFVLGEGHEEPIPIQSLDGTRRYPDLETFLEAVVLAPVP
jgi:hypothetical protein